MSTDILAKKARVEGLREQAWARLRDLRLDIERLAQTGEPASERDREIMQIALQVVRGELNYRAAELALGEQGS